MAERIEDQQGLTTDPCPHYVRTNTHGFPCEDCGAQLAEERKIPLDQITSVTFPKWVFCEVVGCGWTTPNNRGSFPRYCEHVRTHTVEEWEAKSLDIDGDPDA